MFPFAHPLASIIFCRAKPFFSILNKPGDQASIFWPAELFQALVSLMN
jgi:hypothetical protein